MYYFFIHPRLCISNMYLPGRSLISASCEHAVSRTVHLSSFQLWGKRDSLDWSEDQRSVVVWCLSVCLSASSVSSCDVCVLDWLWAATFHISVSPSCIIWQRGKGNWIQLLLCSCEDNFDISIWVKISLGNCGGGECFIMIKHYLILKAPFKKCIFWAAVAEWNDHVCLCSPNSHHCY